MNATVGSAARPGQEAILPAVLEFPEAGQAQFLAAVITRLDPHAPAFKLAPVYTLYLCARSVLGRSVIATGLILVGHLVLGIIFIT